MNKKLFTGLMVGLLELFLANGAGATLTKVGTAAYNVTSYNLIYDDDLQITWLDYTQGQSSWQNQADWAAGLNEAGVLTYNFIGYTPIWTDVWRLPSAGNNPQSGYNQTTSDMGHLFYTEMGLSGGPVSVSTLNSGVFDNLVSSIYWSGTEYANNLSYFWGFSLTSGSQFINDKTSTALFALAVRPGEVSAVPVPGAVWFFGSGLVGLVGTRLRRKK